MILMEMIRSKNKELLDAVEQHYNRKFRFRHEIETLFEQKSAGVLDGEIEKMLFYAKFLSNAHSILSRSRADSEDILKLKTEFISKLEKVSSLFKLLIENTPNDFRKNFENLFLSLTQKSADDLLALLYELSWLKNYQLDNKSVQSG
jgi:hypothetical protein